MNVFYTNACPVIAAYEQCIRHRNKMIVESAQLLSSVHHILGGAPVDSIYKLTHKNHPSAIWVRRSKANYNWVLTHAIELCHLYFLQTGKRHKTEETLVELCHVPDALLDIAFNEPPCVVEDDIKHMPVIQAYKATIIRKFTEWTTRAKPMAVKFAHGVADWISSSFTGYEVANG